MGYKENDTIRNMMNRLVDNKYGDNNKIYVMRFKSVTDFVFETYDSLVEAVKRALELGNAKIINNGREIKYKEMNSKVIYFDSFTENVGEINLKVNIG